MEEHFNLMYFPEMTSHELRRFSNAQIIFTNPNSSPILLNEATLAHLDDLEVVVTASTGTVHIDQQYCASRGVRVISLTTEYATLKKISSTAEHALCLTLHGLRNIHHALKSVEDGQWDYLPFVGRQINQLTVGVIGYGRLGTMYAHYCRSMGAKVVVCDPWKTSEIRDAGFQSMSAEQVFEISDVISLHIHAQDNSEFVNSSLLEKAKETLLLVNTSRGEIVCDHDLVKFLRKNPDAKYNTDVLSSEFLGLTDNVIYMESSKNKNITITPHIGGMTKDAQFLAYHRALQILLEAIS